MSLCEPAVRPPPNAWVLGPLHGGNFVFLLLLACVGAADELWPWWFPGLVLVTAGPPGSLIGRRIIQRRLAPAEAAR